MTLLVSKGRSDPRIVSLELAVSELQSNVAKISSRPTVSQMDIGMLKVRAGTQVWEGLCSASVLLWIIAEVNTDKDAN